MKRSLEVVLAVCALGCDVVEPMPDETKALSAWPAAAIVGVSQHEVLIDFTTFGEGNAFEPDFYRRDGILFPPQRCGSAGCIAWFVGFVQGDDALVGDATFGPVEATFTRPIAELSLQVAPGVQGTAVYVLNVFDASGDLLATTSVTVTQDTGDPADTGPGYFTIGLTELPRAGKSFTLDNVFVRSSFSHIRSISYAVSSISYTHSGKQQ